VLLYIQVILPGASAGRELGEMQWGGTPSSGEGMVRKTITAKKEKTICSRTDESQQTTEGEHII